MARSAGVKPRLDASQASRLVPDRTSCRTGASAASSGDASLALPSMARRDENPVALSTTLGRQVASVRAT